MATPQKAIAIPWVATLTAGLTANDQAATDLLAGLSESHLNWQPQPASWSVGQCLEHLCMTNEAYLPAISAALDGKPDSPAKEIAPGWFGGWFLRSFVEPSPQTKRVKAPGKIQPASRVELSVLQRFHSGNQAVPELIRRAESKNVNRIRLWNPFVPGLRFTVGTGLTLIEAHNRRHLQQAQRVRQSANFSH